LYHYVVNALERDIGNFKQALEDHAKTEGVPAPIAIHPLVDAIARSEDGAFIVAEDVAEAQKAQEPVVTADDLQMLTARVAALELRAPAEGQHNALTERVVQLEADLTDLTNRVGLLEPQPPSTATTATRAKR